MQRQRRNVTEIFASGGSIKTGHSGGGYWDNTLHTDLTETGEADSLLPAKTSNVSTGAKVGNAVAAAAPLLQAGISAIDSGRHTGGRVSIGAQTGSMAVQGAALGTSVLPGWGTLIGGVLGAGWGLIKGSSDNRKAKREIASNSRRMQQEYALNEFQPNFEMHGNRYEDGGLTPTEDIPYEEVSQKQLPAPKKMINVEKDEIMINPMDMTIVQEFTNPNRFSSHKRNQFMEPHGNFVMLPEGHVIVPKKLANRFKKGDILTRKSIVMQLLSDQANDPFFNTPDEQIPAGVEQYAGGGLTGNPDKPVKGKRRNSMGRAFDTKVSVIQPVQENAMLEKPIGPKNVIYGKNSMGRSYLTSVDITTPDLANNEPPLGLNDSPMGTLKLSDDVKNSIAADNETKWGNPAPLSGTGTTVNTATTKRSATSTRRPFNYGKAGRIIAQNAPILAQMLTNNAGDPYLSANPNVNYNDAISLAGQLPEDISIAGTLAANDRSFLVASQAIDNNDTPSARAEKSQLLAEKFAGDNAAYQGKELTKAQLRSTKLQTLLGLKKEQGADWQQDRRYLATEMRMDAAARDNNNAAALVNLSENAMQSQNDDERIKVLNTMTHSVDIDPLAQEIMKEDPGFTAYIFNYMNSGKGDYLQARNEYLTNRPNKNKTTIYDKTVSNKKGETRTTGTKREINR